MKLRVRERLRIRERLNKLQPLGFLYSAYETQVLAQLDRTALPRHVAVLADGNRRWARTNAPDSPLVVGYQAGADKLREFVDWCSDLGIGVVTLWVLSTDNLTRSGSDEVAPLLRVIENLVTDLAASYRVQVVGDLAMLPDDMADRLRAAELKKAGRHPRQRRRRLRRTPRAAGRFPLAPRQRGREGHVPP